MNETDVVDDPVTRLIEWHASSGARPDQETDAPSYDDEASSTSADR